MKRKIPFEKYEATGNDFVILDFFEFESVDLEDKNLIKLLCDRHFGIGADGLIALCPDPDFDFRMKYFNSDGLVSSFCGNGSRASIQYMSSKQAKSDFSFIATDGPHQGQVLTNAVRVKMKDINSIEQTPQGPLIQSGSPHLIIEVEDPWDYPVQIKGKELRNKFDPNGVNVNFLKISESISRIATYERGVEAETLACGTGVTACAYYICVENKLSGHQIVKIEANGGLLEVSLEINQLSATQIWLSGTARRVFSGFFDLV